MEPEQGFVRSVVSRQRSCALHSAPGGSRAGGHAKTRGRNFFFAHDNSRTINSIQASVILIERGLSSQAKVVLRAAMESLFGPRACLNEEFCERLVAADAVKRKKHFRKAEQLVQKGVIPDVNGVLTEDLLAQIEADVAETNARDITTAEIAKAAGLYDWYLGMYAMFSASVHATVRDLAEYMRVDDKGELTPWQMAPIWRRAPDF